MARLRIRRTQGVILVHAKDVAVVRHGERRAAQRLAIGLLARGSLIAVLLHARVDDELCQGQAAVQIEDLPVLTVFNEPQPGFDGDGYGRALAHVLQEFLQLAGVAQKARSAALGHHRSRRTAQVEVDLRVAKLREDLRRPHKFVRVSGEQLGYHVEPLVVFGIDLFKRLFAKAGTHMRRGEKRRVVAV